MRTEWIAVADSVALAADTWMPAADETPPFLLVHGLASNARLWDGIAAELTAMGHPVTTVDLRGHGRSSKPDGPYDVTTVADDLATLIERMAIDRPVVAGQSWGGNVVLELAARRPELIRGIVCVDGGWLEPSRRFADWDACRTALSSAPRRTAVRGDRRVCPVGASRLAGGRDPRNNGQLRGPSRRHRRPVAHVRPPHCGPAGAVGASPLGSDIPTPPSPSCLPRPTAVTTTGPGGNAWTSRRRRR